MNDPGEAEEGAHEAQTPTERFRTQHDWEGPHSISTSVVKAVSAVTGDAPMAIDPLYEALDPDALDELLASFRGNERVTITFSFHECEVRIDETGEIDVQLEDTDSF